VFGLTTLRSTSGPYIEIGRLTREDLRDTKWIRALLGILVEDSVLEVVCRDKEKENVFFKSVKAQFNYWIYRYG